MSVPRLVVQNDGLAVVRIPVHQIRPNPNQPRKHFDETELHALRVAIRADGQLMPILVKPVNDVHAHQDGIKYELIDGERRWRSASLEESGITHLDAVIRNCDSDEQYRLACAANFNREGHTPYEELIMVHHLVKVLGHPQNYVAILLGKHVVWVSQRVLAHERLCLQVMLSLKDGQIPITVATTLAKLTHPDQLVQLKNYLSGGSVTTVKVAVQQATSVGRVQGGVRKSDAKDNRRFLLTLTSVMNERLDRLEAIGLEELQRSVRMIPSEEQMNLANSLQDIKCRLSELLEGLNFKTQ